MREVFAVALWAVGMGPCAVGGVGLCVRGERVVPGEEGRVVLVAVEVRAVED